MVTWKPVCKILGAVTALVGATMLLPVVCAVIYGEWDCVKAFMLCMVPMIIAGVLALKLIPETENASIRMRDGFFAVGFAWLLMSFFGSLPFVISGTIPHMADAFFETASGFTTTGSTILQVIEGLPKSMLLWRSFTHFLGGMGVLVLTVAILPMLGIGGAKLMRAETTGPTMDRISFSLNDTAKSLYVIYMGVTALVCVGLLLCGCNFYDSILHAFSTVGTGGFSSFNDSVAGFNSVWVEIVLGLGMFICGVNFNLYYAFIKGDRKAIIKDSEFRVYAIIVSVSIIFITVTLVATGTYASLGKALRDSFFQVTSLISTTGFGSADYDLWPVPCRIVIFFLFIFGGCASSTAGGVKIIRVMLFGKLIQRGLFRKLHSTSVKPVKIGGTSFSAKTMSELAAFGILYVTVIVIGTLIVSLEKVSLITALSTVLTCLSNIGPGFEMVGPTCNFAFYSAPIKVFLGVLMIAGRLELYTIILLIRPEFWNKYR